MRFLLAALSLSLMLLCAGNNAEAQSRCKDGADATVTGTIDTIEQGNLGGANVWMLKAKGKPSGNCLVEQIWGNGQAPAACTAGKKFSAAGKALDADKFWMLQTDKLTCN